MLILRKLPRVGFAFENSTSFKPIYGAFTLPDTKTETDTETDKMRLNPIDIGHWICLNQYEHIHAIPYIPFLSVSVSASAFVNVNTPLH